MAQLRSQFIGSMTAVIVVFGVSLIIMKIIRSLKGSWNLRISQDGELEGLDIHEHGTPAYHMEFGQGMSYTAPAGLPPALRTPVGVGASSPPPSSPPPSPPSSYGSPPSPVPPTSSMSSDESPVA